MWCWGGNAFGQLGDGTSADRSAPVAVISLGSGVEAVATGDDHTCGLTSDGAVLCWGSNAEGQLGDGSALPSNVPVAVDGLGSDVTGIAAGADHTCALTTGGAVLCWGHNDFGQLGNGTTLPSSTPSTVLGLGSNVAAIAAGAGHTCAVTTTGSALCWGLNDLGQLGDGTTVPSSVPVGVSGLGSGVADVAAGSGHSCALTTAGGVSCWGWNIFGQLGDGTTSSSGVPSGVSGLASGATSVDGGLTHTCAIADGDVLCWGSNEDGQLGDGTFANSSTPVAAVSLGSSVTAVAAGDRHSCAIPIGGSVLCWGLNHAGQLGDGTLPDSSVPVAIAGLGGGYTILSAGGFHTCGLTTGSGVSCWGRNRLGQLGDGTTTDRSVPVGVSGLSIGMSLVSAGSEHTCALDVGGAALCWGDNAEGQLGDGSTTTTGRTTPVAVSGLASGVATIATGHRHTCAVTSAEAALCWGRNGDGQLGDGTQTRRTTPVAVSGLASGVVAITIGTRHSCALDGGGAVVCWGDNAHGQLGDATNADSSVPVAVTGLPSGVAAIAAGADHTCALTTGGGVVCWGANADGQLGNGTIVASNVPTAVSGLGSGVSAIAAGDFYTCALTTAGGALCWGDNDSGQLGDGTTIPRTTPVAVSGLASGVAALAAGASHVCAMDGVGNVLCWGDNSSGQFADGHLLRNGWPLQVVGFIGAAVPMMGLPALVALAIAIGAVARHAPRSRIRVRLHSSG